MTNVPAPMLAEKLDKAQFDRWSDWCVEEKFDGHRRIVVVGGVHDERWVEAYSRPRKRSVGGVKATVKTMERVDDEMSLALKTDLAHLPIGIYDGEQLAGDTATDVRRSDLKDNQRFVVFDMLELDGTRITEMPYYGRRAALEELESKGFFRRTVTLATAVPLTDRRHLTRFVEAIWKCGGEGVIVKHKDSVYECGKRPRSWIKIKKVEHRALTLVGFEPSRGEVRHPGHPYAILKLRDSEGNLTTCKNPTDAMLDESVTLAKKGASTHPWLGRLVVIEYFGRTRDGGYKGPVTFDRWEDE